MGYFAPPDEYDIGGYESQLTCMLDRRGEGWWGGWWWGSGRIARVRGGGLISYNYLYTLLYNIYQHCDDILIYNV